MWPSNAVLALPDRGIYEQDMLLCRRLPDSENPSAPAHELNETFGSLQVGAIVEEDFRRRGEPFPPAFRLPFPKAGRTSCRTVAERSRLIDYQRRVLRDLFGRTV